MKCTKNNRIISSFIRFGKEVKEEGYTKEVSSFNGKKTTTATSTTTSEEVATPAATASRAVKASTKNKLTKKMFVEKPKRSSHILKEVEMEKRRQEK